MPAPDTLPEPSALPRAGPVARGAALAVDLILALAAASLVTLAGTLWRPLDVPGGGIVALAALGAAGLHLLVLRDWLDASPGRRLLGLAIWRPVLAARPVTVVEHGRPESPRHIPASRVAAAAGVLVVALPVAIGALELAVGRTLAVRTARAWVQGAPPAGVLSGSDFPLARVAPPPAPLRVRGSPEAVVIGGTRAYVRLAVDGAPSPGQALEVHLVRAGEADGLPSLDAGVPRKSPVGSPGAVPDLPPARPSPSPRGGVRLHEDSRRGWQVVAWRWGASRRTVPGYRLGVPDDQVPEPAAATSRSAPANDLPPGPGPASG